MKEEKSGEYTFRSSLRNWYNIIFVIISSTLILFYWLFIPGFQPIIAFITTLIGLGSYYLSLYITSAYITLTINDQFLIINQDSRLLNIMNQTSLVLTDIRGFEMNEVTKGNKALFIYTQQNNFYKYPLTRLRYITPLRDFLLEHFPEVKANSNPFYSSFITAFRYAVKRALLYIIASSISIGSLLGFLHSQHMPLDIVSWITPIILSISFMLWWFIIRIHVKTRKFRFGAFFWMSNFFFYTSTCIFIPIFTHIFNYQQQAVELKNVSELLQHQKENLFLLNNISYAPRLITHSSYKINNTTKGKYFTVVHHYTTPIAKEMINVNQAYPIWLLKEYTQKIIKKLPTESQQMLMNDYHEKFKEQFKSLFRQKPIFFVLLKSDNKINNLISSSYNASSNNIILEPHWEDIKVYKKELLEKIGMYTFFFFLINLIGCIFIAANR